METRDVGKRFVLWGTIAYPARRKILFRQPTYEYDPPYRYSNAVVIRLWRWGLMLGKWERSPTTGVAHHLAEAVRGRIHPDDLAKLEPVSGPDCDPWL